MKSKNKAPKNKSENKQSSTVERIEPKLNVEWKILGWYIAYCYDKKGKLVRTKIDWFKPLNKWAEKYREKNRKHAVVIRLRHPSETKELNPDA